MDLKQSEFQRRLFKFKLKMQRAAKEIGKPLRMSGTKVLQSDARYKSFGDRIASGKVSGMRGPMTAKQKAALKKAQKASAIARRKNK
jgi:hypothetical protein